MSTRYPLQPRRGSKRTAAANVCGGGAYRSLWTGPLRPVFYSSGLVAADHVFYATQELNWNWSADAAFAGLQGIAYSTDDGQHWTSANVSFPAPLGNLNWVIRGRGGVYRDGYVYAIASEREFNASSLIIGRSRPDVADMTNPGVSPR